MEKIAIIGGGNSHTHLISELAKGLCKVCENEETNPINLGISVEEYVRINEVMNSNQKKKSNGFLEGEKMNKILGKRK